VHAFAVEARAQLSAGLKPALLDREVDAAERTMAPAAVRWFAARITRDRTLARRVGAIDGWDLAHAWIASSRVLGSTATTVELVVHIEDALHIEGTLSNTLTEAPYAIGLARASNGAWRIQHLAFQEPYDANN
jgi:hypothetical protein